MEPLRRLAIKPPFAKEQWRAITLSELQHNRQFLDYVGRCAQDMVQSGRAAMYAAIFQMITHLGRMPEFDEPSFGEFLKEAGKQPLTVQKLESALDTIVATSGPNEAHDSAAEAFEFLYFAADIAEFGAAQLGEAAARQLAPKIHRCRALAIATLTVAINIEYGIVDDKEWRDRLPE